VSGPALRAGFYGKLPSAGDFLTRRVPPDTLAVWDNFLRHMTATSQARAGADWPGAWLEAPVWHMTAAAGVLGPAQMRAVLVPGMDRVGRFFPFTILCPAQTGGAPAAQWALAAETICLDALETDTAPDDILARLETCALPAPAAELGGRDRVDLARPTDPWPAAAEDALGPPRGGSLWWCRGTARVPAILLRCPDLPAAARAGAMMVGGLT